MPVKYDREDFRQRARGTQRFAPDIPAVRRRGFGTARQRGMLIIGTSAAALVLWLLSPAISSLLENRLAAPAAERVVEGVVVQVRDDPSEAPTAVVRVPIGDNRFVRDALALPPEMRAGLANGDPVRVVLRDREQGLPVLVGFAAPHVPAGEAPVDGPPPASAGEVTPSEPANEDNS
jgi:hypothetical protein